MNPLPLTNFEELMLWEDHPAYPCNVFVRTRFSGRLHRTAVENSVAQAIARHPLLTSKIELRRGRWHWLPTDLRPTVVWNDVAMDLGDEFPGARPIDLQNEIGMRVHVSAGGQASDVIFQFHHACCDGAGFYSFLHDFMICLAGEQGQSTRQLELPDYDPSRLATRDRYGLTWWKLLKMLPRQLVGLQGAKQFMLRNPTPLVPHTARSKQDSPPMEYPSVVSHRFTADETIQLRQAAQRLNVMANEMLARNIFVAIFEWQRQQGLEKPQDWLRMMVPMDLRSMDDRYLPAANVVSSIFLDRRSMDASDPGQLLTSIHDEMELIKRNQLGLTMLFSLSLFRRLPGGIRKSVRSDKCTVSCIFTNMGKVFVRTPLAKSAGRLVVGDLMFEGLQVLVPLRPYNAAAFCAHQYAGRLVMDMHYDPGVLSREQASRVLEIFAEQSLANPSTSIAESMR